MFISAVSPFQGFTSRQNVNPGINTPVNINVPSQPTDAFVQQKKAASPSKVTSPPHFGKIVHITVLDGTEGSEKERKNKLDNLLIELSKTHQAKHVIRGHFDDVNKTIGIFFDKANDPLENLVMPILDDDTKTFKQILTALQALKK